MRYIITGLLAGSIALGVLTPVIAAAAASAAPVVAAASQNPDTFYHD